LEDLAGLGKIAEVILNKVASVTGILYEPTYIRRIGRAKAEVDAKWIIKRTEAEITSNKLHQQYNTQLSAEALDVDKLRERAGQRLIRQEINRQKNLEHIVYESLAQIDTGGTGSQQERAIKDDWMETFIRYAQDISEEGVRQIWSSILSSQATEDRPAISKATLDALRLLEPRQAKVFKRAAQLFISMGQIMDIEPHGNPEISFNMNVIESLALEDIGFLKRVTSKEVSLDFHGLTFTFWKEYISSKSEGNPTEEKLWNTGENRASVLNKIEMIAAGESRDTESLRHEIQIDRFLLTSRGYELASILFEGFYEMLSSTPPTDLGPLDAYASEKTNAFILKEWAKQFSIRGAVVVMNLPTPTSTTIEGGEKIVRTRYRPSFIFDPIVGDWVEID